MQRVLTIGDCIVDVIEQPDGSVRSHAGGAGLNLAVGLARLGLGSTLLSRVGADREGFRLLRYLRERQVTLLSTPNVEPTGRAVSRRIDGQPSYVFSSDLRRRRYIVGQEAQAVLSTAAAVSINSYPFENQEHVSDLAERLAAAPGLICIDPNPRSDLITEIAPVRSGIARLMPLADLVKLSEEDIFLLLGCPQPEAISALFAWGARTVVLTRGAAGASLFTREGEFLSVPACSMDAPIVDTMGAGDATLASLIAFCLRHGVPRDADSWGACLRQAMRIAAATCRREGGELVLPDEEARARQQAVVTSRGVP